MAQSEVDLQGQVLGGIDTVETELKDNFDVDNSNRGDSNVEEDGKEKVIYLHILRLGESLLKKPKGIASGYMDATNDWYVIKQGSSDGGAELSPVFEGIRPLNDIALPDNPLALIHTTCQAIGSCIYVIGGCSVLTHVEHRHVVNSCSCLVRCLDTRNPKDGWRTCFTLPFHTCEIKSTLVNDHYLFLFGGERLRYGYFPPIGARNFSPNALWGCGFDVNDESKEVRKIMQPGCSSFPSFVSTLSANSVVTYMEEEGTLYELDCSNCTWSVYQNGLPYEPSYFLGGTAVSDDGIFYLYDTVSMRMIGYDFRNKKELEAIEFPNVFHYGRLQMVKLTVLAKDRFCIIWHRLGRHDMNCIYIFYTRFSVSHLHSKPTVVLKDHKILTTAGHDLVNVVAVDSGSDATA